MNLRLLTTIIPPPPGFEARLPDRRDLLGGPLALLLAHEDEIEKLLGMQMGRVRGVVITIGNGPTRVLGEQLWHVQVPANQIDRLPALLEPSLSLINQQLAQEDERQMRSIRLVRLQRELDITHRDYQMVTEKLRRQVEELTEAKAQLSASASELRGLNQDLEQRVHARTLELAEAKEAAESANLAKTFFLATMSHEVRTPMNGVMGLLDLLQHGELTEEQRRLLMTAQDSAHVLLNILDDILDFSKIEAGRLELELIPVNLRQLLDRLTETLASNARRKQLQLSCEVDPALPEWVLADPLRLRQILFNLGSNAVKFTETTGSKLGTVRISAEVLWQEHEQVELMLCVQDNGIGMSPTVHDRLFAAFSQADSSTSRRYGGTGLGLSISKRLAELMGGRIGVDSEVGAGSTFWVRAPFRIAASLPGLDAPVVVPAAQRPMQLLVVDDNATNRLVATKMLEKLGHSVEVVGDGEAALSTLAERRFDLVFMDCQMPALDGFEVTERLRARESSGGLPHQPVIAMTASVLPEERRHCFEVGMDDFLSKPIQLATIAALLARWGHVTAR